MAQLTTAPLHREGELLRLDPGSGTLRARRYQVAVTAGPDAGRTVSLEAVVRVGTQPDCELHLADETVSRYHLELHARGDGVRVHDLASTNGTMINALKVTDAIVEPPATIRVGKTELRLSVEEQDLGQPLGPTSFGGALGQSHSMRRLFGMLERVASTDSTVLLLGETGTGKEVLAAALHAASPRKAEPFVIVDCGALSPELIESELFGHAKGAFTGAHADRKGAFVEANRGTVFLDEIGELPLELQPKLLRVLESGSVKRVGEDLFQSVDLRVVAATHRDLRELVKARKFREDLYFRLAVVQLTVPPLRERKEDVATLVRHFVDGQHKGSFEVPAALLGRLEAYSWPGNVRELRNVVERALAGGDLGIDESSTALAGAPTAAELISLPFKEAKERLVGAFMREYLSALLEQHDGNISQVARTAGIARNYVQKLIARFNLKARS